MSLLSKLRAYAELMRWHKPIGSLLLLWPTLWALWLANAGHPPIKRVLIFCAGVFIMRSAGCIINDVADRHFDGSVQRTKTRPLVTGRASVKEALLLFSLLCLLALFLVIQLNRFTIMLSCVGLLLATIYPFTKRITYWPQLVLGLAFSWSIPLVFAATYNYVPSVAWWLFATAVIWPLAYDTQYAMVDREDDLAIGIKSTAILFGAHVRLIIAVLQLAMLLSLFILGLKLRLSTSYFIGLLLAAFLFGYQSWLIKVRMPASCFKAFLNNQWVGLIVWLGIVFSIPCQVGFLMS
jgi:4-hydroxybenzoate polyprenyltransferase